MAYDAKDFDTGAIANIWEIGGISGGFFMIGHELALILDKC